MSRRSARDTGDSADFSAAEHPNAAAGESVFLRNWPYDPIDARNRDSVPMSLPWFEVDSKGLAKLIERRGKSWAVAELLQNAFDAPGVSQVTVSLVPIGRALAELTVEDDSPNGFTNLGHCYTFFAESEKKSDPTLRGRFNMGEKLALALFNSATVTSTKGTIEFLANGTRRTSRRRRERGTLVSGTIRMTSAEVGEAVQFVKTLIVPEHLRTVVNGEVVAPRPPLRTFECSLLTDIADDEGHLRRGRRKTTVRIFEPLPGMTARLYELGIPVMETGDRFDVEVMQKVPLSFERDEVPRSYLRELRTYVLNNTSDLLTAEEATSEWVLQALSSKECGPEAVRRVINTRFGEKVVVYDPSDPEANHRAVAEGYHVVHGRTFDAAAWNNIREANAIPPAGQVTPSPRPFDPKAPDAAKQVIPTPAMATFAAFSETLATRLLGCTISVVFFEHFGATAAYGHRKLIFNVGALTPVWFEGRLRAEQLDLLIHEFGHELASNHLSNSYHRALTNLGAKATMLALAEPQLFDLSRYGHAAREAAE